MRIFFERLLYIRCSINFFFKVQIWFPIFCTINLDNPVICIIIMM